jgi:hypothetical protein
MDSALQRIRADVDRTGQERGMYTTSAESRARESVAEVGLKIVNVGEYVKLPSGEYLKKEWVEPFLLAVYAKVPKDWNRLFEEHIGLGSAMKFKAGYAS